MRYILWVFVLSSAHAQIQINELMIDPNPVVQLPDAEYIELKNISDSSVNLKDYFIADLSQKVALPDTVILEGEIVVLVKASTANLFAIKTIGLSSWPTLNNTSDEIRLYYTEECIDSVLYESSWLGSGGVSLERRSVSGYCSIEENWGASIHKNGGSPGLENSIFNRNPIIENNKIKEVTMGDSISIVFKKALEFTFFDLFVDSKKITYSLGEKLMFKNENWNGVINIRLKNLENCKGELYDIDTSVFFSSQVKQGDILINEILFNPIIGGEDFVEVINTTKQYLDLSNVELSNFDEGQLDEKVSLDMLVIEPQRIICFTKNKNQLLNQYPKAVSNSIVELSTLPTFRNDSGTVVLSLEGMILDRFSYNEKMHHELLEDVEGVSLERVNTNNLWHSASSSQNFGTPGYNNSQFFEGNSETFFSVEPKVFTPDGDGYNDFAVINYNLDNIGYVGNIRVYDLKGTKIKTLVSNSILDVEGQVIWDGTSDIGGRADIGYYIVLFELDMHSEGKKTLKKTVALGTRFN